MKWVCSVCGYVYEGEQPPVKCPQCGVPASKFVAQKDEERVWAAEHVVGVAKGAPEEIIEGLRANFAGECSEVGMYLAMARVAVRAIPKSACTGKRLPLKKPSMPPSLPNFWARS